MVTRAARLYKEVSIQSAPKSEILARLFERCIRDIGDARRAIGEGDVKARAHAIDHAFRIISELSAALDAAVSPELCQNLTALYDYVLERLATANNASDVVALTQAEAIVASVGESFRLAEEQK